MTVILIFWLLFKLFMSADIYCRIPHSVVNTSSSHRLTCGQLLWWMVLCRKDCNQYFCAVCTYWVCLLLFPHWLEISAFVSSVHTTQCFGCSSRRHYNYYHSVFTNIYRLYRNIVVSGRDLPDRVHLPGFIWHAGMLFPRLPRKPTFCCYPKINWYQVMLSVCVIRHNCRLWCDIFLLLTDVLSTHRPSVVSTRKGLDECSRMNGKSVFAIKFSRCWLTLPSAVICPCQNKPPMLPMHQSLCYYLSCSCCNLKNVLYSTKLFTLKSEDNNHGSSRLKYGIRC